MIKHIVLFQLKPFASADEKMAKMQEIKSGLENLKGIIKELRSIEVGLNCNPNEKWDIVLVTTFDNMEDLDTYANHPDHLAVGKIIGPVKNDRACVDFVI
ncbi:MAG: Dabb family protein [Bacteroidales bacterium]|nr:Dabb family protein [Bacteroidales bacterium]